jgi:hypothetical protein
MGNCKMDLSRARLKDVCVVHSPPVEKLLLPVHLRLDLEYFGKNGHEAIAIFEAQLVCIVTLIDSEVRPSYGSHEFRELQDGTEIAVSLYGRSISEGRSAYLFIVPYSDRHLAVLNVEDLVWSKPGGRPVKQ